MSSSLRNETIGQRLRYERQRLNWSQEELAQAIGTTSLSINRWEHDKALPRPRHRAELCRVFNQSADALFELQSYQASESATIWNVPHLRNLYFTGREAILARLHDAFKAGKTIQAINGMGGMGKTQLAVEYAYQYKSEYSTILWTRADSLQSFITDFVAHARALDLPEKGEGDQQRAVNAVKRWLQTHARWLLILDNVDDLALIYDYLSSGNGHILITTRSSATGPHIKGTELDKMSRDEGILFLLRRSKHIAEDNIFEPINALERDAVEALYELADGLPLALDQAAAYVEENHCTFSDYHRLYQSHRAALLKRRGIFGGKEYPHPVATTWSLSFAQVEQADPVAVDVLRFCAFLHPDTIPEEMLVNGAIGQDPDLYSIADDPIRLDAAIGTLRRYSLVRRNSETKMLTIHRLLQAVLRDAMTKESKQDWAERTVRFVSQAFPGEESSTWQQCERYLPHALTCVELIEQWEMQSSEAAQLLSKTGYHLYERGQYIEAMSLCQHALAIREQLLGQDHPDVATSLNDLAVLCIALHQYEQVEPLCLRALAIQERALGPGHPDVAVTLNDLAMIYYLEGRYDQIEPLYLRALTIFERGLGPLHTNTATALNNLAKLYVAQEKYVEAESLMRRALNIREQIYGHNHPDVANSLHTLALLFVACGKLAEAESFFQNAIVIREKTLEPSHRSMAETFIDMARLLSSQDRFEEAEPLYNRALAIFEHLWGPEHPDLARMSAEYNEVLKKLRQKV
jgi:tetratricopeptide (TPR) repeat protein